MERHYTPHSDRSFKIIIIVSLLLIGALALFWFWPRLEPLVSGFYPPTPAPPARPGDESPRVPQPSPPSKPSPRSSPDLREPAVVDLGKMESDADFQALMERRKERYGIEDSLDMILGPEESLKIGDTTIPMAEIRERIRLKQGRLSEENLAFQGPPEAAKKAREELFDRLEESRKRYYKVDQVLKYPGLVAGPETYQDYLKEKETLEDLAADFQQYQESQEALERHKKLYPQDETAIRKALTEKQARLEAAREKSARALKKALGLSPDADEQALDQALDQAKTRMEVLEKRLLDPKPPADPAQYESWMAEYGKLRQLLADAREYEQLGRALRENQKLLAAPQGTLKQRLKAHLNDLRLQTDGLEGSFKRRLMPEHYVQAYGIHVVRPKDNVWNIHFDFLREYFENRGITLSPRADEPLKPGVSSGVGKILKFSENMVHIYNVRERRLSMNLDRIHPQNKIVVFNLGRAFSLLDQIDYQNVRHIEFDGQTLWIPAESEERPSPG